MFLRFPRGNPIWISSRKSLSAPKRIAVIGAGFIGVEMSDELKKAGKDVTLVEILPHILGQTFDDEFAEEAEKLLSSRGVKIVTGVGVDELVGDNVVRQVRLKRRHPAGCRCSHSGHGLSSCQ